METKTPKTKRAPNNNGGSRCVQRVVNRRSFKCNCDFCQRGRRFYKNTEKLPKTERDWMRGFYDAILNAECEEEMHKAANASHEP